MIYKTHHTTFGSLLPQRNFSSEKYRFGFNGKEMDNEVKGITGTQYDYGFRIYDPRLGKFLSVDPLTRTYPMLTPYQFASNTPIWASDLDGLEADYKTTDLGHGKTLITITIDLKVKKSTKFISNFAAFKAAVLIKLQIQKSLTGYDPATKTKYVTKVNLDFESSPEHGKDFYLDMVNDITDEKGQKKLFAVGRVDEIGNTNINRIQILLEGSGENDDTPNNQTGVEIARTGTHEVGHTGGNEHPESNNSNPNNVMNTGAKEGEHSGTEFNLDQVKQFIKSIDKNKKNDSNNKKPK